MPPNATLDRSEEAPALAPATSARTARRLAAHQAIVRRLLAATAGLGVVATVLAFVALSRPAALPKTVRLPSAKAAYAAFQTGLSHAKAVAVARPAVVAPAATAGSVAVQIKSYAFTPDAVTIKAGTKVTWTNYDTAPHTVTVDSGPVKFSSPTLQKGDSFTYTFTAPGTYSYYCAVHPDMVAKVVVTGSSVPPTPTSTPTTPAPSTSSSSGMPMPSGGSTGDCAVSSALQTFLTHVNTGHLGESPGQQVQDITDLNQYVATHLALVQKMISGWEALSC